jgi:hypothetical protein
MSCLQASISMFFNLFYVLHSRTLRGYLEPLRKVFEAFAVSWSLRSPLCLPLGARFELQLSTFVTVKVSREFQNVFGRLATILLRRFLKVINSKCMKLL